MMRYLWPAVLLAGILALPPLLPGELAAQQPGRRVGVMAGAGLGLAPLGEIAERNGMLGIPGAEYEGRLLVRTARGREWSVGVLWADHALDQSIGSSTRSRFDMESVAVVGGVSMTELVGTVPLVSGIDAGWVRLRTSASTPSHYTDQQEKSRTTIDAATIGVALGVPLPVRSAWLVPRVRVAVNYPDFGGGDGYSALHREDGLGFRASFGIAAMWWLR